ncbi:MAG: MBL fold metallo-hydrolase [Sphingomonadaceae bacterium]|nr:MBL fold metallo-hydrolase [Sphingomonadaceae bacterium]
MTTPADEFPDSSATGAPVASAASVGDDEAQGRVDKKKPSTLKVRFHGALGTVTGSAHFLHHIPTDRWLAIDCGLLQEENSLKGNKPEELPIAPSKLAYLFITHAHLDHIGMLPSWIDAGFDGPIWCSRPTAELICVALDEMTRRSTDSLGHSPRYYADFFRQRLVCPDDAAQFEFGQPCLVHEGLEVALYPTSHMVGSVAYHFRASTKDYRSGEICFLGDVGPVEDDAGGGLMPPRIMPSPLPRNIVCESTYGDRLEDPAISRDFENRQAALKKSLRGTLELDQRCRALVPVFTMQRTTDVLLDLVALVRVHALDLGLRPGEEVEIVVPSEVALKYAKVMMSAYERVLGSGHRPWFNPNNRLLGLPAQTAEDVDRQLAILRRVMDPPQKETIETTESGISLRITWGSCPPNRSRLQVILTSSGSTSFGQAHQLIYRNLDNPSTSLLLVGYVPESSIGGQLKRLAQPNWDGGSLTIPSPHNDGKEVWPAEKIAIQVNDLSAWYSGHATQRSLLRIFEGKRKHDQPASTVTVMLVHGRPLARISMVRALKEMSSDPCLAQRVSHAHFPTQLSPEYDVGRRVFDAAGMDVVRTRGRITVKGAKNSALQAAYSRLWKALCFKHGMMTPRLGVQGQLLAASRWGDGKYCRHHIMIKELGGDDLEVVVESDVEDCRNRDNFIHRLFLWNELFSDAESVKQRQPLYCGDHEVLLQVEAMLKEGSKGLVLYSSRSSDWEAAQNLCTYLAGNDLQVVVVETEYWNYFAALGIEVGPWIANAVIPGLKPIPFTSDDYFGIAPVLVSELNRVIPPESFHPAITTYGDKPKQKPPTQQS